MIKIDIKEILQYFQDMLYDEEHKDDIDLYKVGQIYDIIILIKGLK